MARPIFEEWYTGEYLSVMPTPISLPQVNDIAFSLPSFDLSSLFANVGSADVQFKDHIPEVCCCGPCSNQFDPQFDVNFVHPSEVQSSIPGDITTTAALTVGAARQEGVDFAGDTDWFSITLTAGETYTVSVAGATHGAYIALTDATVALYNESGTLLTQDDDAGSHVSVLNYADALLTFTAATSGTFFVEAGGAGGRTGGYTVLVETRAADSVANGPNSAATHTIGETTTGDVNYNADQDWYAVELVAGQTYEFILTVDFPNTLGDGYLSFHNSEGELLVVDDDGGPGLGSRVVYTVSESGTYYISAQGFTGNSTPSTGTYTLTSGFTDPLSPIDSIDWGSQLTGTTIEVYFADNGETFDGTTSLGWDQFEIDAAMAALNEISENINLTFVQSTNASTAEFKLLTFDFTTDADEDNDTVLGFFGPPSTGVGTGIGVFGRTATGWSAAGLEKGGFGYVTLIHEFGHGLGLAHPHDGGGNSETLQGVTGSQSTGIFDLNQGIYTTMSYVDGWAESPYGTSGVTSYGWQATMMAFDLAVLQAKYGARAKNEGDNIYELPSQNSSGTFWEAIWDTGGIDTIRYSGTLDANIDLRDATLEYEVGGGGYISHADTIHGGFTIANSVVIENAIGGSGNDMLVGNESDNVFTGGAGNDNFVFERTNGDDRITDFNPNGDTIDLTAFTAVEGQAIIDSATQIGSDVILTLPEGGRLTLTGVTVGELSSASYRVQEGEGPIIGTDGDDILTGTTADDVLEGRLGNDALSGLTGSDTLLGGSGNDDLFGDAGPTITANEGFVYRLYLATLDREADLPGLEFWAGELDSGARTQSNVATGFVNSAEFQSIYGALDDEAFVTLLYNNVLNRAPDPAGLQSWLDLLSSGSPRADVVIGFVNSPEFIDNTEFPAIEYFAAIEDAHLGQVYRAYGAVLDRQPDPDGFLFWVNTLDSGEQTLQQVIDGFTGSQEFQNVYGSLTDTEFVTLLYNNVLNRDPDAAGLQSWLDNLANGMSRAEVVLGFSESAEFVNASAAGVDAFVPLVYTDRTDTLNGGSDNDNLFGGRGVDTFVFDANEDGSDTIYAFDNYDVIQLNNFGYANAAAAAASLTQNGSDVVFSDQGVTIVISNTTVDNVLSSIQVGSQSPGSSSRQDTFVSSLLETDTATARAIELLKTSEAPMVEIKFEHVEYLEFDLRSDVELF